jgi:hypothetical protein
MNERNLLVVLLDGSPDPRLRDAVAARGNGPTHVHVVAPTHVTALQWLATDEDEARARADVRALEAEWTLADEADVKGERGDVDPIQAVDDALRGFPADEIILVGANRNGGLESAIRRFGVPVTRLGGPARIRPRDRLRERARGIVYGRSRATPFVFFAGVNLALLALAALISLVVVLVVLWLR